jgi:hypothetical protein
MPCDWCSDTGVTPSGKRCPVCEGKGMDMDKLDNESPKSGRPAQRLDRPARRPKQGSR